MAVDTGVAESRRAGNGRGADGGGPGGTGADRGGRFGAGECISGAGGNVAFSVAGDLLAGDGRMEGGSYAAGGYDMGLCVAAGGMGGPLWGTADERYAGLRESGSAGREWGREWERGSHAGSGGYSDLLGVYSFFIKCPFFMG